MFMAPGFAMLEAGMVLAKTPLRFYKECCVVRSSVRYVFACGLLIMYGGEGLLIGPENTVDEVLASGGEVYYSARSDFFFQVVFVATAMSIISGAVASA